MISKEEFLALKNKERLLKQAAEILHVSEADLPRVVDRFLKEIEEMDKELSA